MRFKNGGRVDLWTTRGPVDQWTMLFPLMRYFTGWKIAGGKKMFSVLMHEEILSTLDWNLSL